MILDMTFPWYNRIFLLEWAYALKKKKSVLIHTYSIT